MPRYVFPTPIGLSIQEIEETLLKVFKVEKIENVKEIISTLLKLEKIIVTGSAQFSGGASYTGAFQLASRNNEELPLEANDFELPNTPFEEVDKLLGNTTVTGFRTLAEGGKEGQIKGFTNWTASKLTFANESLSSKFPTNRIHLRGGVNFVLEKGESVLFRFTEKPASGEGRWVQL